MPFTFAHPAIVLPLRKSRYFHFPALLIGSMAPDFEYFFRMQAFSKYSHTLFGMFYVDVPLVIWLWFLYVYVVERPLLPSISFQNSSTVRSPTIYGLSSFLCGLFVLSLARHHQSSCLGCFYAQRGVCS